MKNVFQGHDVSFKQIILENKLGGAGALTKYIKIRSSQVLRMIDPVHSSDGARQAVFEIVEAFEEAQKILKIITIQKR